VRGLAHSQRLELGDEIGRERGAAGEQEADAHRVEPVGAGALVVDQVAHRPRLEPEALGRERREQDKRQHHPGADLEMIGVAVGAIAERGQERRLLREIDNCQKGQHACPPAAEIIGSLGNRTLVH
jgi:hypothetical protein